MRIAIALSLAFAVGCATSTAPRAHEEPELQLVQMSTVADVARNVSTGIPVQYNLTVHNTTKDPLVIKRIELQSQGYGAYTLSPFSRAYDQTVDAGASAVFDLWATAAVNSTISGANGPVTVRTIVQFESPEGRFQTVSVQQVHSSGGY